MAKLKYKDLREKIIDVCLTMNKEGINQGTSGNVSVRTPDGFLITASGVPYKKMKPHHIIEMDLDGGYHGDYLPSTEWRMHLDIFKARKEAGAIVHVHSTYATALSCLRRDVPAFHYMIGVAGGVSLRCAEYAEFGTQELSVQMLKAMEGRTAALLANHGQICFSASLDRALWLAGEIESLCHQFWAATLFGRPAILTDAEMVSVLKRFKTYGIDPKDMSEADASSRAVYAPVNRGSATHEPAKQKKKSKD
jgi:L-fuculose-phosphate aldolase